MPELVANVRGCKMHWRGLVMGSGPQFLGHSFRQTAARLGNWQLVQPSRPLALEAASVGAIMHDTVAVDEVHECVQTLCQIAPCHDVEPQVKCPTVHPKCHQKS